VGIFDLLCNTSCARLASSDDMLGGHAHEMKLASCAFLQQLCAFCYRAAKVLPDTAAERLQVAITDRAWREMKMRSASAVKAVALTHPNFAP